MVRYTWLSALAAFVPGLAACPAPASVACGDGYCDPGQECSAAGECVSPAGAVCGHDDDFVGEERLFPGLQLGLENPALSRDELTMYYSRGYPGELEMATRRSRSAPFEDSRTLGINTPALEYRPYLDEDGTLYFTYMRDVTSTPHEIWVATAGPDPGSFEQPSRVAMVGYAPEMGYLEPFVTAAGMYFARRPEREGLGDLFFAPRDGDGFGAAESLGSAVNTSATEEMPTVSRDGLALYFTRVAPGLDDTDRYDIWVARRSAPDETFGDAELLTSISKTDYQVPGWLSDDNCRMYYTVDVAPGKPYRYEMRVAWRNPR